jgi:hypothetical protein
MTQKRADAAPGDGGAASVTEEKIRQQQVEDAAKLPKPVITPPPAPGIEEEQIKSSWVDATVVNAWLSVVAQDTRDSVIEQIGRSILNRFNADANMAVGKAVTSSWLDNQLAAYAFPITIDDVKSKTRELFETNGVDVREG